MSSRCWYSTCATVTLALLWFAAESQAQSMQTKNTYALDDPANQPVATIDDVAWLTGAWTGVAFGEKIEEVWNPPSGGSMVGMFKLFKGVEPAMYELFIAVEDQSSLVIKLKHFGADFKGWEKQDEYISFPLVKLEEDAAHFAGLSYHRVSNDELHAYLAMPGREKLREEKIVYKRRSSD